MSSILLYNMYHIVFIHSFVNGHLGCFRILAIVNSTAMNIGGHISFQTMFFSRYMPRSGIAALYGNYIFSLLRKLHIVLHSGCTNLHSHWSVGRFFPILSLSFIVCRLFDDGWCEMISLGSFEFHFSNIMISDDEHLFLRLFVICMSPLEKCLE